MTRTLTVDGALLTADADTRTLTYRLLPFGEQGRTSLGAVTVAPGTVELPNETSTVVLNMEHDRTRPVGRAVRIREESTGLVAAFAIARTRAGDDLLEEAAAGLRPGVSVELADPVIRAGALVSATLTGAGAVTHPAFPGALLVAADTDPDPDDEPDTTTSDDDPPVSDPAAGDTPPDAAADRDDTEGDPVTDTTLTAAAPIGLPSNTPITPRTLDAVSRLLAQVGAGHRSPELLAALSDITQTANADATQTAWLNELWTGNPYTRQIVPLIANAPLTAYKLTGWKWATAPVGGDYAGDKAAVPSNAADTVAVDLEADRWAGAHDVDRKFRDFGDESFWQSYWEAMAASYSAWSDTQAVTAIVAGATAVTPAGTGVVAAIVKAALQVIPRGMPSFCLLGAGAFGELVERDPLAFLSGSVSLTDGTGNVGGLTFRTHPSIATDQVIVGARNAATFYELGGGAPIRVDTISMVNGGVDVGAFGYAVTNVNAPLAIAKATVTPVTP